MRRGVAAIAAVVLLGAACSSSSGGSSASSGSKIAAEVASYELLTGQPNRFLVGLFSAAKGTVSYGSVQMRFSYLGTQSSPVSPQPGPQATGTFLLVPNDDAGQPPATDAQLQAAAQEPPAITQPDQVRGVYQANDVRFDRAGYWRVDVSVKLDGATQTAAASFPVVSTPAYPAPGQKAFATQNLVYGEHGVKPSSVDSRATGGWSTVPDKVLHQLTVKQALAEHIPVVVVASTPLYCQSRFCGPVTDDIQQLAEQYGKRAAFVHLEIWKNYQTKTVNKAAAQWVYRDGEVTEPWVFLIGRDGKIVDRWQNVLDRPQLEQQLAQLAGKAGT